MNYLDQSSSFVSAGTLKDIEVDDLKCNTFSIGGSTVSSTVATPVIFASPGFANETANPFYWIRVGDIVSFSGSFQADYGGVTVHEIEFTPPSGYTSNFTAASDCVGTVTLGSDWKDTDRLDVQAEITDNTIIVYVTLASTSSLTGQNFYVSGHYRIR